MSSDNTTVWEHGTLLAEAAIVAASYVSAPLTEAEQWRSASWASSESSTALAKLLRNSDEQTIAGMRALTKAMMSISADASVWRDWAVIGCPRFLGRMIICGTVGRYFHDPKYNISPHIIPNYTLHAVSGTMSVGFTLHGANFGVGGGPRHLPEGLLTALSVVSEREHPGVWLIASEFEPEPRPDDQGKPTNDIVVHALALALQFPLDGTAEPQASLRLERGDSGRGEVPTVRDLGRWWEQSEASSWRCRYEALGTLIVDKNGVGRPSSGW